MTASLEHEPRFIGSFDGTMLAVRSLGNRELPPLLLVPSVGSNLAPWRRALPRLLEDHHIVTWDLRGLHES
ncbi:MAG: hypothetical protein JJE05_04445, partial [Actinobacteria bacterium]|nr:hypothetical protein [Actinomycetota bacterium]